MQLRPRPEQTPSHHQHARSKIERVEAIPLRMPFRTPFKIATAFEPERTHIDVLIVRLWTDDGASGIGETQAWRRQGSSEILPNLVHTIESVFAPLIVGRSPFDINAILTQLQDCVYNSLYAQAAVGDALYDLVARKLNVPVYELFGGKCRDRIRVGAILGMSKDSGAVLEEAESYYARGFRHLRFKIGVDPAADVRNVARVRGHFGDKVVLRADANAGMRFDAALQLLRKLEPYDLDVVEQPVAMWDLEGMAALARAVRIPIAADESLSTEHSLMEIIRHGAASMVQTKIAKNGGMQRCWRLWTIANAAGISIFPGNHTSTSIATAAVAQIAAAWPGFLSESDFANGVVELLKDDIVKTSVCFENGEVIIPDGPGLGVELDEEKIAVYRVR